MTAEQWLDRYCKTHNIEFDKLSAAEQFRLARQVPCTIRCFRVGGPVSAQPGEPCPECGQPIPDPDLVTPDFWEHVRARIEAAEPLPPEDHSVDIPDF